MHTDKTALAAARYCILMEIVSVAGLEHLAIVRQLFEEYWQSFGFTPCFQNFAAEVAGLPGYYAPPAGRLALALDGGEPMGCVALRPLDQSRAEAKRLYVRPQFRSQGAGLALLQWVIGEARAAGYRELLGDSIPVMQRALAMYERLGFEQTGPYSRDATPGAIYLRLVLRP
jgi:putative acetyltransferase